MNDAAWVNAHRSRILCAGVGIIAAWYGILLGSYLLVPALKDVIRSRTVEWLRGEFAGDVRFQSFDVSFLPRVHVIARGVRIGNNAGPLIQAATADALSEVVPWHIRTLVLDGLSVRIPTAKLQNVIRTTPALRPTFGEIQTEHAQVDILPSAGQQASIHFELAHLQVRNFDPGRGADFSALVRTSEPCADIQASGHFGPWNSLDPSALPAQGIYAMPRCDLARLLGLKGAFSSQGGFRGTLQRIEMAGDANAPEFSLRSTRHPEPLHATFQAAIDAWDGSVSIEQVQGLLQTSSFVASGFVLNFNDDRRRDIALRISMSPGRLPLSDRARQTAGAAVRPRTRTVLFSH